MARDTVVIHSGLKGTIATCRLVLADFCVGIKIPFQCIGGEYQAGEKNRKVTKHGNVVVCQVWSLSDFKTCPSVNTLLKKKL